MCSCRLAIVFLTMVMVASVVQSQNLLPNSTFDSDVAGWLAGSESTVGWDPLDANGDPLSGSALVTNLDVDPNDSTGAYRCIDGLADDTFYRFGADILIPGGQIETGHAYLLVQWYGGAGCSGFLNLTESPIVLTSTPDEWFAVSKVAASPSGTQSGRLRLSVWKNEAGASLDAHFDNVLMEAVLFIDGFETGDTSGWSSTMPP